MINFFTKIVLRKYKPEVIGVSGSVGKMSTKLTIAAVLGEDGVSYNDKESNDLRGICETILGVKPGSNIFIVFLKWISLIFGWGRRFPSIFILEVRGAKPGELEKAMKVLRPHIGVVTSVGPTHLDYFGDIVGEAKEKNLMISLLGPYDVAVVNVDNKLTSEVAGLTKAHVIRFGLTAGSDVTAVQINLNKEKGGLQFKLQYNGAMVPVSMPNNLGKPAVYAALAAAAVGIEKGMNLIEIGKRLSLFNGPAGRLKLLPGIKKTLLIDDSYDASPLSLEAALEVLLHLRCEGDKFAVLGEMSGLGAESVVKHKQAGEEVAKLGVDYFVTVGSLGRVMAESAKEYGMNPDRVFIFDNSAEAGRFIQDRMEEDDLLLIKGGKEMQMEKVVKEVMAEPARAKELLVRQEG